MPRFGAQSLTRRQLLAVSALGLGAAVGASRVAAETPAIALPELLPIPAGPFIFGSDRAERELAYDLDEAAYGHDRTRRAKWYANEPQAHSAVLPAFAMTRTAITNRQYADFVAETNHRLPDVERPTWQSYGLIHPYERTRRFAWSDGGPPAGREDHPVVLVSQDDAVAYAEWLKAKTGRNWWLPSESEWEKAARGTDGRAFPWGSQWNPARLNSHDSGPFDTLPVGSFPAGASPFGLLDAAGQVFEWTATPAGAGRFIVKGGSWDDKGCGVCRPAARHGRPEDLKHILIGFRLAAD